MLSQFQMQIITTLIIPNIALIPIGIMTIRKWKQSKENPYNLILACFFLSMFLGLLFNLVYSIFVLKSQFEEFIIPANFTLAFLFARLSALVLNYSLVFLLFFLIALDKSFKTMDKKMSTTYFIAACVFIVPILFVGNVFLSEDFVLRWDITLALYSTAYSIVFYIPLIIYSIKIFSNFSDAVIKRRFNAFIVGLIFIIFMLFAVVLVKLGMIPAAISALFSLLAIFLSPLLIYYGVARKTKID